jgi:hypothetical protein
VYGANGDDVVDDGPLFDAASDKVLGGPGDDAVDAFNDPAFADVIECGPGNDAAYTDGTDVVANDCEKTILGPYPDFWEFRPYDPIK